MAAIAPWLTATPTVSLGSPLRRSNERRPGTHGGRVRRYGRPTRAAAADFHCGLLFGGQARGCCISLDHGSDGIQCCLRSIFAGDPSVGEHAGSWSILSGFLAGVREHSHGASEINRRIDVRPGRLGSDPCSPPLLTGLRRYGTARNLACDDGWSKGPRPGGICACGLRMLDGPAGPLEAHRAGSALSAAVPMRRMACARIR